LQLERQDVYVGRLPLMSSHVALLMHSDWQRYEPEQSIVTPPLLLLLAAELELTLAMHCVR